MRTEELCVAYNVAVFLHVTTRWQSYIVGVVDERGDLLHIEPMHVLLEKPKEGQVQSSQSGLLALQQSDPNDLLEPSKATTHRSQMGPGGGRLSPLTCSGHQRCA